MIITRKNKEVKRVIDIGDVVEYYGDEDKSLAVVVHNRYNEKYPISLVSLNDFDTLNSWCNIETLRDNSNIKLVRKSEEVEIII